MQRLRRLLRLLPPFVWRDIREQYAGSALGLIWSLVQPLLLILLYWLVFAQIMQIRLGGTLDDIPFIAYLLSGLLPWFAFQDGLSKGANAVIGRRDMVKKVHFPVQVFPLAAVTAAFVSHAIGFALFLLAFLLWRGQVDFAQIGLLVVLFSLQWLFVAGLGLCLAAVTVYIRDITQIIGIVLMAMFYTAPVLYPLEMVPEGLRSVIMLNPFTPIADSYHRIILLGTGPEPQTWLLLLVLAGGALALGRYVFKRLEPGFADVL